MRFHLRMVRDMLAGPPERQFMMGGVSLGSAITALEQATGRPLIWVTHAGADHCEAPGVNRRGIAGGSRTGESR
jgi:acyl-CoA thioesterase-2